jgi:hypothetical protein
MNDKEIFDLAEKHGWMDDFNRWNFQGDVALLEFADALAEAVKGRREWVGLHEHELQVLEYNDPSGERLKLAKAVEAKLKEKNT